MCNAKKHSPGCTCGFGPPYPPRYRIGEVREWAEEAVDRPTMVRRSLREAGWDARGIEAFAERYAALQRSPLPRASRVEQVKELLRMRRRVVEDSWIDVVEVPLYRFGAPPVKGAKVEYSEGDTDGDACGWTIKFLGVGVSSSTSVEVSRSCTFVAADGAWKQVYVPVKVRVSRVSVHEGGLVVGHGHEAHVLPASESGDPLLQRRGIRSVGGPPDSPGGVGQPIAYHAVVDLSLAGDTSGAVHKEKRIWVTDIARELSVPLSKLVDVSALVRVKRTRRLELNFELPGGHNYRAYLCNGYTLWESPSGTLAKKAKRPSKGDAAA